ncbi:MAG: DUF4332 domain-containing protein [Halobacteriales archaeon]
MGLLSKLKSVFGLGQTDHRDTPGETRVTVEREPASPDASSERAVKESEADTDATASPATGTETTADSPADTAPEPASDAGGESVERIKGIGPTYAERLGTAGIETVAQLAEADPAEVAAETDLSEARLEKWIERAKAR